MKGGNYAWKMCQEIKRKQAKKNSNSFNQFCDWRLPSTHSPAVLFITFPQHIERDVAVNEQQKQHEDVDEAEERANKQFEQADLYTERAKIIMKFMNEVDKQIKR